jgi:hypothetical protein
MSEEKEIQIRRQLRQCGDCTKCCEGWLANEIHGHFTWPGKKCQFVETGTGCSIYEDRPETCQRFECEWLKNYDVPAWLKPNKSNVILRMKYLDNIKYLEIIEAGEKLSAEVLSWALSLIVKKEIENMKYQISGGWCYFGTEEFYNAIRKNFDATQIH